MLAAYCSVDMLVILLSGVLGGAAIFGIGWGVYGYCPGPAMSAMAYLDTNTFIFVGAMLAGMALVNRVGSN